MDDMSAAAAAAVVGDGGVLARFLTAFAALSEFTTSPRVVNHPPRGGGGGVETTVPVDPPEFSSRAYVPAANSRTSLTRCLHASFASHSCAYSASSLDDRSSSIALTGEVGTPPASAAHSHSKYACASSFFARRTRDF